VVEPPDLVCAASVEIVAARSENRIKNRRCFMRLFFGPRRICFASPSGVVRGIYAGWESKVPSDLK